MLKQKYQCETFNSFYWLQTKFSLREMVNKLPIWAGSSLTAITPVSYYLKTFESYSNFTLVISSLVRVTTMPRYPWCPLCPSCPRDDHSPPSWRGWVGSESPRDWRLLRPSWRLLRLSASARQFPGNTRRRPTSPNLSPSSPPLLYLICPQKNIVSEHT